MAAQDSIHSKRKLFNPKIKVIRLGRTSMSVVPSGTSEENPKDRTEPIIFRIRNSQLFKNQKLNSSDLQIFYHLNQIRE